MNCILGPDRRQPGPRVARGTVARDDRPDGIGADRDDRTYGIRG